MLGAETTATTAEILSLTNFSAAYLGRLERDGVIKRESRNAWLLIATIAGIIAHLRDENRRGKRSEAADRLARAKAQMLEVRIKREAGQLIPAVESLDAINFVIGQVVSRLVALPNRYTRDVGERRRLQAEINILRTEVADVVDRESARLAEVGQKAARRR